MRPRPVIEAETLGARLEEIERDRLADRVESLEATTSRLWAVVLEIAGRLPPAEEPIKLAGDLVPLKVAAHRSGFSESGLRRKIRTGALAVTKIGGKCFISAASLTQRPRKESAKRGLVKPETCRTLSRHTNSYVQREVMAARVSDAVDWNIPIPDANPTYLAYRLYRDLFYGGATVSAAKVTTKRLARTLAERYSA